MPAGTVISDLKCCVPREVAYMPVIRVDRAGAHIGALEKAFVNMYPDCARRSILGVLAYSSP